MVCVSLRQNGGPTPQPIAFAPGKTPDGWTETRTLEEGWDAWPHPEDPGLIEDRRGYFDWAGRLLFLPDGTPNPNISGAYRYRCRPDLCDPYADDSDPYSPRYEPMWLRHKPGDTWMVGGKPYDPHDRGPFGSPGWRPDRRTGRHRRGELPDPIPPWEWRTGDPIPPNFIATREQWDAHREWTPEMIEASGRPEDGAGTIPDCGDATHHPEHREHLERRPLHDRDHEDDPPAPRPTSRPPADPQAEWIQPPPRRHDYSQTTDTGFTRMQEHAWSRFLEKSEPLAEAHHHRPRRPSPEREAGWFLALLALVHRLIAHFRGPEPAPAPPQPAFRGRAGATNSPTMPPNPHLVSAHRPRPVPGPRLAHLIFDPTVAAGKTTAREATA